MSKRRKSTSRWKDKLFGKRNTRPCYYCGKKLSRATATFDHVRPLSKGGYDKLKNGVLACARCNTLKSDTEAGTFIEKMRRSGNA